jgi:hypothetical protein
MDFTGLAANVEITSARETLQSFTVEGRRTEHAGQANYSLRFTIRWPTDPQMVAEINRALLSADVHRLNYYGSRLSFRVCSMESAVYPDDQLFRVTAQVVESAALAEPAATHIQGGRIETTRDHTGTVPPFDVTAIRGGRVGPSSAHISPETILTDEFIDRFMERLDDRRRRGYTTESLDQREPPLPVGKRKRKLDL